MQDSSYKEAAQMNHISQWYWQIPELSSRALRWRRQYLFALLVGTALITALGGDSTPVFAECDGDGSPGSC